MLPRKRFVALETSSYLFDMLYKFSPWLKYPRILPQKGNLSLLLLLNGKIIILRTMSLLLTWLFIIHKIIFLNKIMNLKLIILNMIPIMKIIIFKRQSVPPAANWKDNNSPHDSPSVQFIEFSTRLVDAICMYSWGWRSCVSQNVTKLLTCWWPGRF